MLSTLLTIIAGAAIIDEITEPNHFLNNENEIFESLEDFVIDNQIKRTSYAEKIVGGYAYRVYGDFHREKEKI